MTARDKYRACMSFIRWQMRLYQADYASAFADMIITGQGMVRLSYADLEQRAKAFPWHMPRRSR